VEHQTPTPIRVLLRELILFQAKLLVDGLKDLLLVKLALIVAIVDIVFGGRRRGQLFYALLRGGERFDLWLNLYRPASAVDAPPEGLAASPVSSADRLAARTETVLVILFDSLRRRLRGRRPSATRTRQATG
jgi:hypothetical protein